MKQPLSSQHRLARFKNAAAGRSSLHPARPAAKLLKGPTEGGIAMRSVPAAVAAAICWLAAGPALATPDFDFSFGRAQDENFRAPGPVAIDARGFLYVGVAQSPSRIEVRDPNGVLQYSFGRGGCCDDVRSMSARAIDFDSAGNIYVLDESTSSSRVDVFDSGGAFRFTFSRAAASTFLFASPLEIGQFDRPRDLVVDGQDKVFILGAGYVSVYDTSGAFLYQFGEEGPGERQFNLVNSIAVDRSDRVYITGRGDNRIQVFTNAGEFVTGFGPRGIQAHEIDLAAGIDIDASGNIFVVDHGRHRVKSFDVDGNFRFSFGAFGQSDGYFRYPTHIAVSDTGVILVSDRVNDRVQVFVPEPGAGLWALEGAALLVLSRLRRAPRNRAAGEVEPSRIRP
jgi:tripartite motif-containing protein 71